MSMEVVKYKERVWEVSFSSKTEDGPELELNRYKL